MADSSSEQDRPRDDLLDPDVPPGPKRLARAFRQFREGRGREAVDIYRDIMRPYETPLLAHINRGLRHYEHGRHESAIKEFLAAENLDPENVENPAIRLDPLNVEVRVGEAILAFRKGLYAAAEVQLKAICIQDSSHGPAHFYRGEALNRLGRVDEALKVMERAVQLQPGNWRAYHTLGMLFDRKDDRERASEMYRHARELNYL